MKITKRWGGRLLAVWLILTGLMALVPALNAIPAIVMNLIALGAGVLLLLDR